MDNTQFYIIYQILPPTPKTGRLTNNVRPIVYTGPNSAVRQDPVAARIAVGQIIVPFLQQAASVDKLPLPEDSSVCQARSALKRSSRGDCPTCFSDNPSLVHFLRGARPQMDPLRLSTFGSGGTAGDGNTSVSALGRFFFHCLCTALQHYTVHYVSVEGQEHVSPGHLIAFG